MVDLSNDSLERERRGRVVGEHEHKAAIKQRAREILSLGAPGGGRARAGASRPRSTESVLKVIAWTKSQHAAPGQAYYVGRARDKDDPGRQVALENEQGQAFQGKEAIHAEIASWGLTPDSQNRSKAWKGATPEVRAGMNQAEALSKRQAVHLMISIPHGAPAQAETLRRAVREAAAETFGQAGYRYIFAIHTDEPRRPHAHIIVKATSEALPDRRTRQLVLNPRELEAVRAIFTEKVRERGLAVTCTRRADRPDTRSQILAGKEPLRENVRQGKLHQPAQSKQGSIFETKAPAWYAEHGLAFERRRLERWTVIPKPAEPEAPAKTQRGVLGRIASAFWRAPERQERPAAPTGPARSPSPALERLDAHFGQVHRDPIAARESFLAMYREAPKLAVWAANNRPEAFGETTGKFPAGSVTGRGLKTVLVETPAPAPVREAGRAAEIMAATMQTRQAANVAGERQRARRDAAAIPKALERVAARLEDASSSRAPEVAEIRKIAEQAATPAQASKLDGYHELDREINVRDWQRSRQRDQGKGRDR